MRTLLLCSVLLAFATSASRADLAPAASPAPLVTPTPVPSAAVTFPAMTRQSIATLANTLAAEDAVVIKTDDWSYPRSRHDAGKIDPLDGLPFARNVSEEIGTAIGTNVLLRNPHRRTLLQYVTLGFPVVERSIIGAGFHYWKVFKV